MNTYLLLAYITGGLLVIYALFIYIFPSRKLNLILKSGLNLLSAVNLVFVYLYTKNNLVFAGIGTALIGCVREILFSFRGKWKALNCIAWPIGFSLLFIGSLFFTYKSPLSLLPVAGSVLSSFFFYITNEKLFKTGAIISNVLYSTYYAILIPSSDVLTIFSLLTASMGLVSSVVGLCVLLHKEKKEKNKQIEESQDDSTNV